VVPGQYQPSPGPLRGSGRDRGLRRLPRAGPVLALSLRHWDTGRHGVWGGLVAAGRAHLRRRWPAGHRERRRTTVSGMIVRPPYDAGQQAGGSIGTSLLNTMVASATASYLASHLNPGTILAGRPSAALVQQSLVHGYTVGFWWTAGIFAAGAVVCETLLRRGPLRPRQEPAAPAAEPRPVQPEPPSVRLKAD